MGAWIETIKNVCLSDESQSHPTWVRGLKLVGCVAFFGGRGVAPYVGAWIETSGLKIAG